MERYEAILEQLKKAQGRGLETITNRLDFVVQSLEELIQEAKSSVQGALPQSADEYLPVDDVVAALNGFRDEAEEQRRRADDLAARFAELEAAHATADDSLPLGMLRSLDGARSQSELLRELLPVLSEHVARAVVLVLREGAVSAWSGIGFTDGELLRGWQGKAESSPALRAMEQASAPVAFAVGDDPLFDGWIDDELRPDEAMLVPVVLRGRTMGAIYVDRLAEQPWSPGAAQTLVALVCLLIDTLALRSGPSAMLADPVGIEAAGDLVVPESGAPADAEGEAAAGEEVEAPPEVTVPAVDPSATVRVEAVEPELDEASAAVEMSDQAEETFDASAPVTEAEVEPSGGELGPEPDEAEVPEEFEPAETPDEAEVSEEFVPAEVEPEEPRELPTEVEMPAAPPAEEAAVDGAEPVTPGFLDEPPPVQPVQPPPDEPEAEISEDEALNEEAQRFARLLVSEIKLYNEEQVERGREARDIYRRLQEDIDRSREMFEKRISAQVRAKKDYFRDELVRILADGDPDLLGM